MKYDLNRNELIEAYINGELSEVNTKEFEALMNRDHRLKTEVEQFSKLYDGLEQIRQRQLLQKDFDKWDAKMDRRKKPYLQWLAGAAAAILILVSVKISLQSPLSNEALFASYYEAYPNVVSPIARSGAAEEGSTEKIMFLYESEKYEELIPMIKSQDESPQWHFYLGICYLATEQETEAIASFERIDKQDNFYNQKLWYQALSYLREDQKDKCSVLLKEIVSRKSFQHKNARLLLDEI